MAPKRRLLLAEGRESDECASLAAQPLCFRDLFYKIEP
jgi:hypothetical protein